LNGVEIFLNMSGSHYETGKHKRRLNMILEATLKTGGVYIYSNLRGCDGGRVYFDGASIIA
jgi:NAD+ synthase (glutamine-hydrolysing)